MYVWRVFSALWIEGQIVMFQTPIEERMLFKIFFSP